MTATPTKEATPFDEVEKYVPTQPTEAGFSTNAYLTHPMMGRQQFTFRGATSQDWGHVLEDYGHFCAYMREKGWKFDGEMTQAAPPIKNPTVAEITGEPVYEDIGPEPPDGKSWITFDADLVKVLPQPDNKTTLEFYQAGRQFAGVKVNKWKVENANGLMKHVTSEPMDKAAEYKLHCRVFYTEGKEGTTADGKKFHYKDVSHVRPL